MSEPEPCCSHPPEAHTDGFCSQCECGGYFWIGDDVAEPTGRFDVPLCRCGSMLCPQCSE